MQFICKLISEPQTFDSTTEMLQFLYACSTDCVFARYLLATLKQEAFELVQKIKANATNCDLRPISPEGYRHDTARAVLNIGLQINSVGIRLWGQPNLDF